VERLAELVVAVCDLLAVEARELRRGLVRTGVGLSLVAVAALLVIASLALALWSLHLALASRMAQPLAGCLTAAATLALAGSVAWLAHRVSR